MSPKHLVIITVQRMKWAELEKNACILDLKGVFVGLSLKTLSSMKIPVPKKLPFLTLA